MFFSKHYKKLDQKKYTTIRRRKKGVRGETLRVWVKGEGLIHRAKITKTWRQTLATTSTGFLKNDTGCNTREEAIALIQSFYPKPIILEKEKFYFYELEVV